MSQSSKLVRKKGNISSVKSQYPLFVVLSIAYNVKVLNGLSNLGNLMLQYVTSQNLYSDAL